MTSTAAIITEILRKEGDAYTDHPSDSGGPTKYGITLRTLRRVRGQHSTAVDVAALTEAQARAIYYQVYVVDPGFVPVLALSPPLAEELVDSAVNLGPARASEWLQRALNALNRQQRDYADIPVDGDCGPRTVAALRTYLARRGDVGMVVMLRALNCLQGEFYISLAERRPKDGDFLFGWLRERVA